MGERSSPPCSSPPWAPVICSSPIHSGGLSMDNPFEMFDEVGRSLKWFSLSRNAPPDNAASFADQPPSLVEEAASQESYDSDSSSTISWNKNSEELTLDEEHRRQEESSGEISKATLDEVIIDHEPKVELEEIYDEPCARENHQPVMKMDDHYPKGSEIQQAKLDSCLYTRIAPPAAPDKDPVSGLVRSFFGLKQDARKVPDAASKKKNDKEKVAEIQALEKKIETLEAENGRVKKECQRFHKLLKEKEDESARFSDEKASWEKQSLCSMQEYSLEKEELVQELKREKRLLEKRFHALSQIANPLPNKEERREIADLKAKLVDVHEEHLKKEARLRLTNIRLRKHVKEISGRLNEKQEEIKRYERLLLECNIGEEKPAKPQTSPEEVPGGKTVKKVECLSKDAAIGCRITGALFYDSRPKKKKEVPCKESADNKKRDRKLNTTSSVLDVSGVALDFASDHKRAASTCKEKSSSELGTEDGASMDGAQVDELGTDHESVVSDVLSENRSLSKKQNSLKQNPLKENAACGAQRRSLVFTDGTREEEYQDGLACLYFPNGDIKNTLADGTTEYYYAEIDTWHTTKPDGVEIFYFPQNQIEEHWPDGRKRIIHPDGTTSLEY